MGKKVRGNQTLSGTWAELWWDGEKVMELSKITVKVTINREDVQIGQDIDSKMTSLKGEYSMTTKKVYSRYAAMLEKFQHGYDVRGQMITKLSDPDAVGGQQERYSIDNCWVNDLPLVDYEQGGKIEEEITGGFTPSDMINLDRIA